ncbi:anthranilate phosphoribosyltransferase [Hyphomonas johnsonii]|uniref:Anthranilate phosphoribosyltransferase n=1 Tax=Hyphomonas johnsonii MHS-2 TaxID=1280950 RepID=A0A059FUP5_9PROT|nr:anthranilate phosphoribosyltransferase [Hyphomonas johnsonii]KCZ94389.1 anthranilate phosphoribosyltransferase [Hyphomonas johnsonii MHS-2]
MTDTALTAAIKAIARHETLDGDTLEGAFNLLLTGEAAPEEIGAFLTGLAVRGETAAELVAGARIMRQHARTVHVDGPVLDTCGTGGLTWKSLNTSTASALVIAAAGGRVAKHGNRSVPPKSGSADVLEALGVNLESDEHEFRACLDGAGVAFMFARAHHSAMRHVAPVRAKLGIRTIFNLLGPLSNPAGAQYQVLGVFAPEWTRPMAEALAALGTEKAWVVHGIDGIDEISVAGTTHICEVAGGTIREFEFHPSHAGLDTHPLSRLEGSSVADNALAITDLLDSQEGPFRDAVLLNAAAGLHVFGTAADLKTGVAMAAEAIDSGKARDTLRQLVALSNGQAPA